MDPISPSWITKHWTRKDWEKDNVESEAKTRLCSKELSMSTLSLMNLNKRQRSNPLAFQKNKWIQEGIRQIRKSSLHYCCTFVPCHHAWPKVMWSWYLPRISLALSIITALFLASIFWVWHFMRALLTLQIFYLITPSGFYFYLSRAINNVTF